MYQKIEEEMRTALKKGDAARLSTLRMLLSAVKTHQIDKNLKTVEDADVIEIAGRQVKQRKEAIEQFEKGKRPDLAAKENAELKILQTYLPEQLSDEELRAIIREAISAAGATTKADTGKVMKAVMDKVKGRAEGKTVKDIVAEILVDKKPGM